jgi:polyisoprenyl-phosphate glycosyltransferase
MSDKPELSIVAPCFNEEQVLPEFLRRATAAAEQCGKSFEIIIVDDGSRDGTWRELQKHSAADARIRGIRFVRNFGHQPALTAGLRACRGARVLLIDADLQDPPELLAEMMVAMDREGADIVYGQRRTRDGVSAGLNACYKGFYKVLGWLSGTEIPPDTGDFRLVTRRVVDCVNAMPEQQRFLRGMFSWSGFKQVAFRYDRKARAAGAPAYTWNKLFALAADGIMSFSIKPLRLATALAAFLAGIGLLVTVWLVFGHAYFDQPPQGWTSLMVVLLFVSALQMLVLGVIGEYIGRIFIEQKQRPIYLVAEEVGGTAKPAIRRQATGHRDQMSDADMA